MNRYQMLILIVIDSLKLKYLLMLKLIQVQRYSMMLTQKQRLMSKLKPRLRLTGFLILSYSTMLTIIQMSRLIQTLILIPMLKLTQMLRLIQMLTLTQK